jgi:hypothetical protein
MGFQTLLLFPFLISSSTAWVVTSYYEAINETLTETPFGLATYTTVESVNLPISTSDAAGVSTSTGYNGFDDVTIIEIFLTGSNLPVLSTTSSIDPCATWTGLPGECTSVIGTSTTVNYFAPLTVTQPSSCSQTHFSFGKIHTSPSLSKTLTVRPLTLDSVTNIEVYIPTEVTPSLSATSSASNLTTAVISDDNPPLTTSWIELDLYLAPGQVTPTLDTEPSILVAGCSDPRGCYPGGLGSGCTLSGLAGLTESHGPIGTQTQAGTTAGSTTGSTSGTTSKAAAGRMSTGSGMGVIGVMGVVTLGFVLGLMIL